MDKTLQREVKTLYDILDTQTGLYQNLVGVLNQILDNYFDYLDDQLVNPEGLHLKSLSRELLSMRNELAELFETSMHLEELSQSQVRRLKNLK